MKKVRTVLDVKRAKDMDLYVNMVRKMQAERRVREATNPSKKEMRPARKSNVVPFPGRAR